MQLHGLHAPRNSSTTSQLLNNITISSIEAGVARLHGWRGAVSRSRKCGHSFLERVTLLPRGLNSLAAHLLSSVAAWMRLVTTSGLGFLCSAFSSLSSRCFCFALFARQTLSLFLCTHRACPSFSWASLNSTSFPLSS